MTHEEITTNSGFLAVLGQKERNPTFNEICGHCLLPDGGVNKTMGDSQWYCSFVCEFSFYEI